MGIFDSIMDQLGFNDEENLTVETPQNIEEAVEVAEAEAETGVEAVEDGSEAVETAEAETEAGAGAVEDGDESAEIAEAETEAEAEAVAVVDVVSRLEELSQEHSDLDWKVSIVDLLKLLGIDSSYSHRKELAEELGCPEDLMNSSADMNIWLHKTVLQKIAENGGNIPEDLIA